MEKLEFILRDAVLLYLAGGIAYSAYTDLKNYIKNKYTKKNNENGNNKV